MARCCLECENLRAANWLEPKFHCAAGYEVTLDLMSPNQCEGFEYEPGCDVEDLETLASWARRVL